MYEVHSDMLTLNIQTYSSIKVLDQLGFVIFSNE